MTKLEIEKTHDILTGNVFVYNFKKDDGSVKSIKFLEETHKAIESYFKPKTTRKEKKPAPAPTLQEVKDYFKLKGYSEEGAIKMFDYYTAMEWKDNNQKPVLNWKAKAIAVWFKKDYAIKQEEKPKKSFFDV